MTTPPESISHRYRRNCTPSLRARVRLHFMNTNITHMRPASGFVAVPYMKTLEHIATHANDRNGSRRKTTPSDN